VDLWVTWFQSPAFSQMILRMFPSLFCLPPDLANKLRRERDRRDATERGAMLTVYQSKHSNGRRRHHNLENQRHKRHRQRRQTLCPATKTAHESAKVHRYPQSSLRCGYQYSAERKFRLYLLLLILLLHIELRNLHISIVNKDYIHHHFGYQDDSTICAWWKHRKIKEEEDEYRSHRRRYPWWPATPHSDLSSRSDVVANEEEEEQRGKRSE
jgi:hypothetical protein